MRWRRSPSGPALCSGARRSWWRSRVLEIEGGRHPVVERFASTPFVPNDLRLDAARRMLIITGPNMGGKSTYMRQAALIAVLAHLGSYVPADRAVIGPIDRIFTRIGAADDLAGGRSTFMVEMTEAANILHNATDRSLILMDEIGRGTSTFDGLSLAWAMAHHIATAPRVLHAVRHALFRADQPGDRGGWLRERAPGRHRAWRWHRLPPCGEGGAGEPQLRPAGGATGGRAARCHRPGAPATSRRWSRSGTGPMAPARPAGRQESAEGAAAVRRPPRRRHGPIRYATHWPRSIPTT